MRETNPARNTMAYNSPMPTFDLRRDHRRRRRRRADGRDPRRRARPPRAAAGEGKKPGVKILMSGGTRCNITHDCDARGIVDGVRAATASSSTRRSRPSDRAKRSRSSRPRASPPRSRRRARSSRSAIAPWMCSTRSCGGSPAAGRRSSLTEPLATSSRIPKAASASSHLARTLTMREGPHHHAAGKSYPGCGTTGDGYAWAADVRPHHRPRRAGAGAAHGAGRVGRANFAASRCRM